MYLSLWGYMHVPAFLSGVNMQTIKKNSYAILISSVLAFSLVTMGLYSAKILKPGKQHQSVAFIKATYQQIADSSLNPLGTQLFPCGQSCPYVYIQEIRLCLWLLLLVAFLLLYQFITQWFVHFALWLGLQIKCIQKRCLRTSLAVHVGAWVSPLKYILEVCLRVMPITIIKELT